MFLLSRDQRVQFAGLTLNIFENKEEEASFENELLERASPLILCELNGDEQKIKRWLFIL